MQIRADPQIFIQRMQITQYFRLLFLCLVFFDDSQIVLQVTVERTDVAPVALISVSS